MMRKRSVCVSGPIALALFVGVAACGKGGAPGSPTTPSGSSSQTAALSGATVAGTVMSGTAGSGATSFNSKSAAVSGGAITVTVAGTTITATVDASGHFTLQNVPTGDITLLFTASGINANVTLTGIKTADQIRITVVVNGNTAALDEQEHATADNQAEIEGRVTATACSATPQTITVGTTMPTTVNVQNAKIHFESTTLTCAQIQVNDRVEARGTKSGTTIVATDVQVETPHAQPSGSSSGSGDDAGDKDGHEQEGEVTGTVAGAAAGHACPAFTFSVGSTSVTTSAATKFEDISCAGVVNGIRVEVDGTKTAVNAIAATKVQKK